MLHALSKERIKNENDKKKQKTIKLLNIRQNRYILPSWLFKKKKLCVENCADEAPNLNTLPQLLAIYNLINCDDMVDGMKFYVVNCNWMVKMMDSAARYTEKLKHKYNKLTVLQMLTQPNKYRYAIYVYTLHSIRSKHDGAIIPTGREPLTILLENHTHSRSFYITYTNLERILFFLSLFCFV